MKLHLLLQNNGGIDLKRKDNSSSKKGYKIAIVILLVILIVLTVVMISVILRKKPNTLAPDYAPQEVEQNAQQMSEEDNEKLDQQDGGGAVSLSYSKDVSIKLDKSIASLYFANPNKSNQDMILQIFIQDSLAAQSGLMPPGYEINEMDLSKDISLSEGLYEGKFIVSYYQRDSGEKAMINTEIPLTIEVVK